jgi:hypothetical protein
VLGLLFREDEDEDVDLILGDMLRAARDFFFARSRRCGVNNDDMSSITADK